MIRVPAGAAVGDVSVPGRHQYWMEFVAEDLEPITIAPGEYVQEHVSISWRLNSGRLVAGVVLAEADSFTVSADAGGYPRHVGLTIDHTGEARAIIAPAYVFPDGTKQSFHMYTNWFGPLREYGGAWAMLAADQEQLLPVGWLKRTLPKDAAEGGAIDRWNRGIVTPPLPSRAGAWDGFLRLSWLEANTFRFEVSVDGSTWERVIDDLTFELSPTHMGGFAIAYRGKSDATCTYDLLERSTGAI
jgi:hypothetical protein